MTVNKKPINKHGKTMTGERANEILTEPTQTQSQQRLNTEVFDLKPKPSQKEIHTMDDAKRILATHEQKHPEARHSIRQGTSGKFYIVRHTMGGQHIVAG